MSFKLTPIDTVDQINTADFTEKYLKPRRPLIIRAPNRPSIYLRMGLGSVVLALDAFKVNKRTRVKIY